MEDLICLLATVRALNIIRLNVFKCLKALTLPFRVQLHIVTHFSCVGLYTTPFDGSYKYGCVGCMCRRHRHSIDWIYKSIKCKT